MSASTGRCGQRRVDGRHGAHRGDPVVLDDRPELAEQRGVAVAERPGPHHLLALEQRRQQGDDQRVDVEQRQRGEHRRRRRRTASWRPASRRRRPRWRACARPASACPVVPPVWNSAARSAADGGVAGEARRVLARRPVAEVADAHPASRQRVRARPSAAGGPQRPGSRRASPAPASSPRGVPDVGGELRPGGDEHPGAGAAQQLGEVLRGQAAVERRGDPGQLRGQRRGDQLGAVRGQQRDRVAAADAERVEHVGVAVDVGEQLGEGPLRRSRQRAASGRTVSAVRSGHSAAARASSA